MSPLEVWLRSTSLAQVMHSRWAWPAAESLHFFGLSLLLGTVGLFDLRLIGFAKQIPLPALHRLIPWGIFGYFINIMTGICFFTAEPDGQIFSWVATNNTGPLQRRLFSGHDAGKSWHALATDYQDAAGVPSVFVFATPKIGYGTVRGGIQRTVDGGARWTLIKTPGT